MDNFLKCFVHHQWTYDGYHLLLEFAQILRCLHHHRSVRILRTWPSNRTQSLYCITLIIDTIVSHILTFKFIYKGKDFVSFHALFIALGFGAILIYGVLFGVNLRSVVKEKIYFYRESKKPPSKFFIHKQQTLI